MPSAWRGAVATANIRLADFLVLKNGGACFDQGVLDVSSDVGGENRARIQGSWHRLLPRPEHLIELATCLLVNQGVRIHEGLIHIPAQEESVRGSNVLDDGIDYIQSRQLLRRRCLQRQSEVYTFQLKSDTYCSNVILQDPRYGHRMLRILLGDDGQVADLKSIVGGEVFQVVLVVFGDLLGYQSRHGGVGRMIKILEDDISEAVSNQEHCSMRSDVRARFNRPRPLCALRTLVHFLFFLFQAFLALDFSCSFVFFFSHSTLCLDFLFCSFQGWFDDDYRPR